MENMVLKSETASAFHFGNIVHLSETAHCTLPLMSASSNQPDLDGIVGESEALRSVLAQMEVVAPTDSTVLIYGETGTGKELIARAVHNLSPRKSRSLVKFNCAAFPTGLLESELFGHEKGAFTGAITQRLGRFELADQGTIFLDEIGEIPLELQPKLLRVLQEREFEVSGLAVPGKWNGRPVVQTTPSLRSSR
jgi:formate hydrogenlyase transcriptional activator